MRLIYILNALGLILKSISVVFLLPCFVALICKEYSAITPFFVSALISLIIGFLMTKKSNNFVNLNDIKKTEALFIVALSWVSVGLIATIPYLFFGLAPINALFEAFSGITTTGASILTDYSIYPKAMFFWRSFSQWLGGMGIIVMFIAVLPQFAVAGRQMFFAEAPGPTEEKITPRIRYTANALWKIYIALTIIEICILTCLKMPFFDAVCNSFSTLSGGGFSPNSLSIYGYGADAIVWVIGIFMFFAAMNFSLQYKVIIKRNITLFFKDEEWRFYLGVVFTFTALIMLTLILKNDYGITHALREAFFQVTSIISTSGFVSENYILWNLDAKLFLFILMFMGGCAGSASGGIKAVRILFLFKYLKREIAKILHPNAVLPIKINKMTFPEDVSKQIMAFIIFFIAIFAIIAFIATILENNLVVGVSGSLTTITNTGPGFGLIGPFDNFNSLHPITKLLFIFNMVIGRLELIPFLAMLHPDFWNWKN